MVRLNVSENSYNKYYKKYDDSSEEDETPLPICFSCQEESLSLNRIGQCVPCEIEIDEYETPRLAELPLCELNNVAMYRGNIYWYNQNRFNKIN